MFGEKKKLVMCQECRALIDPAEKACPMCGNESVPEVRATASGDSKVFFSYLILAINVLLFVLMVMVGMKSGSGVESFITSAPGNVLQDFGSLNSALVKQGEWWRLVTPNFLHIGLVHLLFNSYALSQIAPLAEEIYGEQKFISIYLLTGILSFIGSYVFAINGAGASGALFGLIGLLAAYGYRQGGVYGKGLMKSMLIWGGINIMIGFAVPGINNVAHIGGFISGGALGFLIKGEHPTTARTANLWNACAVISVVIIISSFALVGKNYGAAAEHDEQTQNVIRLSKLVREARQTLYDTSTMTGKNNTNDSVKTLRRMADDISNIKKIDDRSDEIRARLVAALNKTTDAMDVANKNTSKGLESSLAGVTEFTKALEDYLDWEDSILGKYGLVKTGK
jgi:rhomboid protease GluP